MLLARGDTITTIDNDPEMIRVAVQFGFKVWYGDGAGLDILHAAATKIAALVRHEFPNALLLARDHDCDHGAQLVKAGVDYPVCETFGSAFKFSNAALDRLGEPEDAITDALKPETDPEPAGG